MRIKFHSRVPVATDYHVREKNCNELDVLGILLAISLRAHLCSIMYFSIGR